MIIERLQRLQEPCCDVIGGVFGLLGTAATNAANRDLTKQTNETNRAIAQETNQANKEIAQQTNETNLTIAREANAAAKEEAELSYQRSTASAKIDELVAAGISPQQAKMIVAGQGATGTYTAAPQQVATAVAPTMQTGAPMVAPETKDFSQSFAAIGDAVDKAYNSPNGGSIGLLRANDAIEFINDHIADVGDPTNVSSFKAFSEMLKNAPKGSVWANFRESDAWRKIRNSTPAQRAFMYNLKQNYADNADIENRLDLAYIQIERETIQKRTDALAEQLTANDLWKSNQTKQNDVDISNNNVAMSANNLIQSNILTERDQKLKDVATKAKYEEFELARHQYALQDEVYTNKEYKSLFLQRMLTNESAQIEAYKWAAWKNGYFNQIAEDDPEFAKTVLMYEWFDSIGFGNTDVGQQILKLQASGISATETFQQLESWKKSDKGFDNLNEKQKKLYEWLKNASDEEIEAKFDSMDKVDSIGFKREILRMWLDEGGKYTAPFRSVWFSKFYTKFLDEFDFDSMQ